MATIIIAITAGLGLALGGCLNKISKLKWEIQLGEAHNRELERIIKEMQPAYEHRKHFREFNLIIGEKNENSL